MKQQHLYKHIREQIEVIASNRSGKFVIEKFRWKGSVYKVIEHCLTTKAMRGYAPVWFFSVNTDYGSYQIRFDTETLTWWLEEIHTMSLP